MKKNLFILLLVNFITLTIAQDKRAAISGILLHKPWSKSTQSYCAQGSDYFVIKTQDKEFVLESENKQSFKKFINRQVILQGYFKDKEIKNNPMEQHPVSSFPNGKAEDDVFQCTVFVVGNIKIDTRHTIKAEDFCVKSVEFYQATQTVSIDLEYKGAFFSYPILQIEVDGAIVANEEAIFEFYGQTQGMTTHIISSTLKSKPKQFTVLVMSGMNRVPIRLSYPCK